MTTLTKKKLKEVLRPTVRKIVSEAFTSKRAAKEIAEFLDISGMIKELMLNNWNEDDFKDPYEARGQLEDDLVKFFSSSTVMNPLTKVVDTWYKKTKK